MAGALGAQFLIFGEVGRLGERLLFTLSLFDSEKAQSSGRVMVQGATVEVLAQKLPDAVEDLLTQGTSKIDLTKRGRLEPWVYYSGLTASALAVAGIVISEGLVAHYATERDRMYQEVESSGEPLDGSLLGPILEAGSQARTATYVLSATALSLGLVSWFVLKPLTHFEAETKTAEE